MTRLRCQAVRWVDDQRVEVRLVDASGVEWTLVDQAPAVGVHPEDELPCYLEIACEVVAADGDLVTVSTAQPWGVEARHELLVTPYQLLDGGPAAREVGFYRTADEVRAAMAGGEQPWEQDALRYLEQGEVVLITASPATDLLDPEGPRLRDRGEWTDGVWFWSGTLGHYLRNYHVTLPEEFLAHMRAHHWTVPKVDHSAVVRRYPFLAEDVAAPVAEA
ncbi:hypothetical protein [Lentzea sp. CA-135723]|uniref:hypothetical protein n=1 Tax=Lentzea sp. CA-135723 TaxID=3239950 RepID=UPI003D94370E